MSDPYKTLGVTQSSTADEIKSAYRKLAKKLHPDVNPGRKDIEQKFKEVTAAYDLLSDPEKRKRYDRGEVDNQGNERGWGGSPGGDPFGGSSNWRTRARGAGARADADPFAGFGSAEDIFAEFMGGGRNKRQRASTKGADVTYALSILFVEAALGAKRRVTLESGKTIDVTIPPGTSEGHKLRLRGQGQGGAAGAGDAIIEIHVEPHPFFTRKENDIYLEVPISLPEAVLGASIKVPILDGHVTVKVPKGANSGSSLRLKGKGIPSGSTHGDMFVKLKIVLPEPMPEDLMNAMEKWAKKNSYDPRKNLGWA